MKRILVILTTIVILISCSALPKYYRKMSTSYATSRGKTYFPLDSTYQLYVRAICREKVSPNFYKSNDPNLVASIERCNCEDMPAGVAAERMEVQYLLYSAQRQYIFYITTIPSYRFIYHGEPVGLYDMPLYRVDHFMNVNDFNTFFIGDINQDTIIFAGSKKKWEFQRSTDGKAITITKVGGNIVEESYAFPIRFYRQEHWIMGIDTSFSDTALSRDHMVKVKGPGVYFTTRAMGPRTRSPLPVFEFEKPFDTVNNYQWLYFMPFRFKTKEVTFK